MGSTPEGAWLLVAAALVVAVRLRGCPPTVGLGFGCIGIAAFPLFNTAAANPPSEGGRLAWALLDGLAALAFGVLIPEAGRARIRPKRGSAIYWAWLGLLLGAFAAAAFGFLSTRETDALLSAGEITAWILGVMLVMFLLGSIREFQQDRARWTSNLLLGIPGLAIFLFLLVFSGVMLDRTQGGSWLGLTAHYVRFAAALLLLVSANAILDRRPIAWGSACGSMGLLALALSRLLLLPLQVGPGNWIELIAPARRWLELCGPALFLLFVAFAPRDSIQVRGTHPAPGLRLQWAWTAAACVLAGLGICAWQLYEVSTGDTFTVWIVGRFIPIPVIVLGALFVIGGLAGFLTDAP